MTSVRSKKSESGINFFKILEDYFEKIMEEVSGMKSLILDKETTGSG